MCIRDRASYVPSATDTDYANLPEIEGAAPVSYTHLARSQATSLSSISTQCVQQNIGLIKVLENFVAEEKLKGHAYDSAKAHITSTVIPLIQGIVLYQESLAEECQKFVSQYTSDVDLSLIHISNPWGNNILMVMG